MANELRTITDTGRKKLPITHKDFRIEIVMQLVELEKIKQSKRAPSHQRKHNHQCLSGTYGVSTVPRDCVHKVEKARQRRECIQVVLVR